LEAEQADLRVEEEGLTFGAKIAHELVAGFAPIIVNHGAQWEAESVAGFISLVRISKINISPSAM
jgi:hypothetical protein